MKKNNQVWVSPDKGNWRVHRPGAQRDIAHIGNKAEAMNIAERIARNQGIDTKVQRLNGTLSSEGNTYPKSRDNCPPIG